MNQHEADNRNNSIIEIKKLMEFQKNQDLITKEVRREETELNVQKQKTIFTILSIVTLVTIIITIKIVQK